MVAVTFGTKFMGKVDEVGDYFWVETRFHHICFAPLIPTGSWIIKREGRGGVAQIKIPTSMKSIVIAWMWYVGAVAAVLGLIGGLGMFSRNEPNWQMWIEAGCIGVMLFAIASPLSGVRKASFQRACELGRALKLSDAVMEIIAESYGEAAAKPSPIAAPPR